MARSRAALQAVAAAHRRGDNTPQPIWSPRDGLDHLAARDRPLVLKAAIEGASSLRPSPRSRRRVPLSG